MPPIAKKYKVKSNSDVSDKSISESPAKKTVVSGQVSESMKIVQVELFLTRHICIFTVTEINSQQAESPQRKIQVPARCCVREKLAAWLL